MHCNNCGSEISQEIGFCGKCGMKVGGGTPTDSESIVAHSTMVSRLFTTPNYLFMGLLFANFAERLSKGFPLIFAAASAVGVCIIPLAFGIVFNLSGSKTSRTAYIAFTVFFMFVFVGATLQSAKDGL